MRIKWLIIFGSALLMRIMLLYRLKIYIMSVVCSEVPYYPTRLYPIPHLKIHIYLFNLLNIIHNGILITYQKKCFPL